MKHNLCDETMGKFYPYETALSLISRMKKGELISSLSKETGISKTTLWRWKNGKHLPPENQYNNYQEWYQANSEKVIERIRKNRMDGNWLKCLERDNYQCRNPKCICKSWLDVHHIDGDDQNHILTNLITLCRACHKAVYRVFHSTVLLQLVYKYKEFN